MDKHCHWVEGGLASHLSRLFMRIHMNRVVFYSRAKYSISLSPLPFAHTFMRNLSHETSQAYSQS